MTEPRGDLIDGRFEPPAGEPLVSVDPAHERVVFETRSDPARIDRAVNAAHEAFDGWRAKSLDERDALLGRFRQAIASRKPAIADAITRETGKIKRESLAEVDSLLGRFAAVSAQVRTDLTGGPLRGFPDERLEYVPHGVVGVIGPFNFPLHLCHAHVVPALLLGNTVVMKSSEAAPLATELYAEAALEAGFPPGVFNVVQGRGAAGAALSTHKHLRALCFTGSWPTGRRILEATIDRPDILVALEMGGKNVSIVCDDADLRQAVHEIVIGGYLSAGQRCTCTDRVFVHSKIRERFVDALGRAVRALSFGDPDDPASFAGPLVSRAAVERFERAVGAGMRAGAEEVARGRAPQGGCYVAPTLHVMPPGMHEAPGYLDTELFGPDVHVESFQRDEEVIEALSRVEYGFASSVFCADAPRFEWFLTRLEMGLVNWNRSTNQASPRLPFGGRKKSGNHRPAGGFAARNLAVPIAVRENVPGVVLPDRALAGSLPPPDLDALDARHTEEERRDAARLLVDHPRPLRIERPKHGALPISSRWLERLYAGNRIVRDKKAATFDHLRSSGPWFVSSDDAPLSVLDGMSQTATLPAGFAEDAVVNAFVEGDFGDSLVFAHDTSTPEEQDSEAVETFSDRLDEFVPGLENVTFVNSGAEACEKAIALCRLNAANKDARKVLAFEGSFHGRTLLALHASHNPSKRVPFEIPGYEVTYAPFPVWWTPHQPEPDSPAGWIEALLEGRFADAEALAQSDALLLEETKSLALVGNTLAGGDHFAVLVEPMQSEGGDRYATARFHRALRLLTRRHSVFLVVDEVQTGFGLGGTFAWHTRFGYRTLDGTRPDYPDCVTFAKRAQVGVVMSRFEDPEPTATNEAALVRGRIHADMVAVDPQAAIVEQMVREKLSELARRFPELVENPRARGYALAFDLPSAELLNAYLAQRFWRGAIVFAAGSRTVRYRLNQSFDEGTIEQLFTSMRESLAWLVASPGLKPPEWQDFPAPVKKPAPQFAVRAAAPSEKDAVLDAVISLEARVYEPARRDSRQKLGLAFERDGVAIVAEIDKDGRKELIGAALATPLERVASVRGPDRDPMRGRENTLYSITIAVDPDYRGVGLSRALKTAQIREAAKRVKSDGSRRYLHLSGRNRVGRTDAMMRVNRSMGAYEVVRLQAAYDDGGEALYYRMPVGAFAPAHFDATISDGARARRFDLSQGVSRPFVFPPASLVEAAKNGRLYGPAVNKITLVNYVTPDVVRATEWVSALTPDLPHLHLASSRDETFDKTVRLFRWFRKKASIAIGFEGGYVGHTTAAARSLSDPSVHAQGPGYFDSWIRVPHPSHGIDATLAALRQALAVPEQVLGLFFEPVQERTGRVVPDAFWPALAKLRADTDVPVALVETASASYRSGRGPFFSSGIDFTPDALTWWAGAQIGFIHAAPRFFVGEPLTFVSTWDGDELSLVRVHHQLRAARLVPVSERAQALAKALEPAVVAGLEVPGFGLFRAIASHAKTPKILRQLTEYGIVVRRHPNDLIVFAPPLDVDDEALEHLEAALREATR
jgi:acyl-CoA reductase-like NAD-dependent aldehyde dehydrogenase/acetylornithine/succinyldiaminopimelate/putrescine aminotransferase/GNAT superfamily N-acetyltransferase